MQLNYDIYNNIKYNNNENNNNAGYVDAGEIFCFERDSH